MLRLQRITTADTDLYSYMEQLMSQSFPANEYRPLSQLRVYTDQKEKFRNHVIFDEDVPVGFLTYWDFDRFCYIEHFAIDPLQRNHGYGQKVLQLLQDLLQRPTILEVEMPDNEMARRRIGFYQRQGFSLWTQDYKQPPYRPGEGFLPMLLMARGELDCARDFCPVVSCIYREVYGCDYTPTDSTVPSTAR